MRIMVILSALLMQLCLGATYSWSVYVQHIKTIADISQAQAQVPFSVFYFIFPLTMIFSGTLVDRFGPRVASISGGLLFGSGWLISSLGIENFTYTILGNGIIAGVGAGIAYIVPISTCMKWFPNNKGLVTGVAVSGFGGGAALVSSVAGYLLKLDFTPFALFGYFGLVFMFLIVFSGFFMQNPPDFSKVEILKLDIRKTLTDKRFIILYFAMFSGLAAGFAISANIKEFYASATLMTGVRAVSFFALSNALGRIVWGSIFDRFDSHIIIQLNLLSQALLLFLSPLIVTSSAGLQIFAAVAGFNYGGILVVYAGSVARIWGANKVGSIYGWLFSANIPGAIAPLLAGYFYDQTGSFTIPMYIIAIIILAAIIVLNFNKNNFVT